MEDHVNRAPRLGLYRSIKLRISIKQVEAGTLHVHIGRVFHLDQIAEAHRSMEENSAGGKIVVVTS
ncbi:zinc-binding dehydrogenase [Bradyrhizobium erythrophlei]|uniref:zinc-binding dehydrogenase n=1 Tax=Bradyrhizobium erythrophlei TaxID=1437360 RepID=UPI0035EAE1AC